MNSRGIPENSSAKQKQLIQGIFSLSFSSRIPATLSTLPVDGARFITTANNVPSSCTPNAKFLSVVSPLPNRANRWDTVCRSGNETKWVEWSSSSSSFSRKRECTGNKWPLATLSPGWNVGSSSDKQRRFRRTMELGGDLEEGLFSREFEVHWNFICDFITERCQQHHCFIIRYTSNCFVNRCIYVITYN